MHDAQPRPRPHRLHLHRDRIAADLCALDPGGGQIVQLSVKDHVGDIADHPMPAQIGQRPQRRVPGQIIGMSGQMQVIISQPLHHQPPRIGGRHGDGHVGLAPGQVDDARQGHDLDLQPRMGVAQIARHLRQQIVRAAVRRADAQLSGQARLAGDGLGRGGGGQLGRLGRGHQARPFGGQLIARRRLEKQRRAHRPLQPGDAAAHGGRVHRQPAPRARQALGPRDGQKDAQIVPVHAATFAKTQNPFASIPLYSANPQD